MPLVWHQIQQPNPQSARFVCYLDLTTARTPMKKISVISGCYNEEGNLQEFYDRIVAVFREENHL
jgi:hypothetical protein